jgi:hypothetical protein
VHISPRHSRAAAGETVGTTCTTAAASNITAAGRWKDKMHCSRQTQIPVYVDITLQSTSQDICPCPPDYKTQAECSILLLRFRLVSMCLISDHTCFVTYRSGTKYGAPLTIAPANISVLKDALAWYIVPKDCSWTFQVHHPCVLDPPEPQN